MLALPKPDVILVHESDLDGFVSGLLLRRLARRLFDEDIRLEAWHTSAWFQRPMKENVAWVADLVFDPRLDRPGWLVIDHHPPLAEPKHARLIHDPEKSASLLAYEFCREQGLERNGAATERLVQFSNVADLFQHEHPDFATACDYAALVKTYRFWNLHDLIDGELDRLLDHPLLEVTAAKRRVEDPLGLAWSRERITPLTPRVAHVPVAVGNSNHIAHQLLMEEASSCPVLLTLHRQGNGLLNVSLRSRNGEALAVATRLQGGGHPNAAGAVLPRAVRQVPEALDYLRRVLAPPSKAPVAGTGLAGLLETFDEGLK